jgi:hypothetical protein
MSETTDNQSSQGSSVALAGAAIRAGAPSSTNQSVIGPTLIVRGEITAEEDLLIRGRVEGTISHDQTLTVHREGTIVAVVRKKSTSKAVLKAICSVPSGSRCVKPAK